MARKAHAKRYAQAVFQIARVNQQFEQWDAEFQKIEGIAVDRSFLAFMENPKIRFEDKTAVVGKLIPDLSKMAQNLVYLLISRNAIDQVGEIAAEYRHLVDENSGIEHAEVVTAVSLDEKEKQALAVRLSQLIGKKLVINLSTDPGLIGGVLARIGGKLLDASTRTQLENMRKQLAGAGN